MRQGGVYLLADEEALAFEHWRERLLPTLNAGVTLVQYRAKQQTPARRYEHARQLLDWCRQRQLPLLINDDPLLCQSLGADGAHLGRGDAAIAQARALLGPAAIIGASCYDQLALARTAQQAGADYVSFGRLFTSSTKPLATPASLNTLRTARRILDARICAIGGITTDNAKSVLQAGAGWLCVAGGILRADDPVAATRKLARICTEFQAELT